MAIVGCNIIKLGGGWLYICAMSGQNSACFLASNRNDRLFFDNQNCGRLECICYM